VKAELNGVQVSSAPGHAEHLDRQRFPIEGWRLVETEFDSRDLGRAETIFAVGNGYLGMRGNLEEGREAFSHGTYVNGLHETWPIRHAEEAYGFAKVGQTIVNAPDAKLIKLYVDDEPLLLSVADMPDLRAGARPARGSPVPRPGVAHQLRQARAGPLAAHGLPRRPAPRDADLRGDGARRRRARRDLVTGPQPAGRRGRVPRRAHAMGEDPRKAARFEQRVLEPQVAFGTTVACCSDTGAPTHG
jgi:alpha,alpha-trehalose phosphorylase